MTHCLTCLGIQQGHRDTCPDCGRGLAFHMATKSEITAACDKIRATWPLCKLRQQEGYEEAEIPRVHYEGGHRRRKGGDGD